MEEQSGLEEVKREESAKQTIIIQQPKAESNGMGIAGFVLAILAVVLSCVPFLNFILWVLGLIFSIVGLAKKPKGLAIAGLIISLLGLIILLLFFLGIFGMAGLSALSDLQ